MNKKSGFTFIETVVGLCIFSLLAGITAALFIPMSKSLIVMSTKIQNYVAIVQAQSIFAKIQDELEIPFWWDESCIKYDTKTLQIFDYSTYFTEAATDKSLLFQCKIIDNAISISWKNQFYKFKFATTPFLNSEKLASKQRFTLVIPDPNKPYILKIYDFKQKSLQ